MKNAHGVEPTQYMKNEYSAYGAIKCYPECGPRFGSEYGSDDIYIGDNCNKANSCRIDNDGCIQSEFECDPEYKKSLFVNTAGIDERNMFSVLDYEVYCIDN